jgi:predicted O-linked N-acetylglucosamine transferase (SPINDLY family)
VDSRLEEAVQSYEGAIEINPSFAEAYFSRGNALQMLKEYKAAVESYDCAVALTPDFTEAYVNRGNALQALFKLDEAIKNFDHAIALNPSFVDAYVNRGNAHRALGQLDAAIKDYDAAINITPACVDAHVNRATALQELGQLEAAIESYNNAIKLKPDADYLLGTRFHTKMKIGDWTHFEADKLTIIDKINRGEKCLSRFPLLSITDSLAVQKKAADIISKGNKLFKNALGDIPKHKRANKIRIGYFSADFWFHPVSILLAELFELHDKNRFEVVAFSFGPEHKDAMRARLENAFDQFIDVRYQSDQDVARLARQMGIDIAVDLGGDTAHGRTGIFQYRAAPIQVGYVGYLGTMGVDYIDYLIADKMIIPQEAQQYYFEKIVYLPSYQANDSKRVISDKNFTRAELGLPENGVVFCCFNNNYKITPSTFDGWMRILKTVKDSVLFLYADNRMVEKNMKKEAQARGVDPRQVIFGERLPPSEYLARYKVADLFLDTFPYNAGTTASDALWAGLPVLTLAGQSFASRVAASLLTAMELPELITHTQEHYEALAIELATQPTKLNAIKAKLAAHKLTTPLFDTALFANNIERAYLRMIERYQSDLPLDHIYID